tara:strand:+ start:1229 stop:1372 length:144 start_codon:yes stop_codon:yes gene_type:complete
MEVIHHQKETMVELVFQQETPEAAAVAAQELMAQMVVLLLAEMVEME